MDWFYLPSTQSVSIWLRSTGVLNVNPNGQQPKLHQLHTLLLPRATIDEAGVSPLLSNATSLKTLHLGMAYRWHEQCALQNGPAILEGLSSVSDTIEKLLRNCHLHWNSTHLWRGIITLTILKTLHWKNHFMGSWNNFSNFPRLKYLSHYFWDQIQRRLIK